MRTLADQAQAFLAAPFDLRNDFTAHDRKLIDPKLRALRVKLRAARRFKLEPDFVTEAVYASSVSADLLPPRVALAKLPFDSVWIEWDQEHRVRVQEAAGTSAPLLDDDDRGLAGALICRDHPDDADHWIAHTFVGSRAEDGGDGGAMYLIGQRRHIGFADHARQYFGPDWQDERDLIVSGWGYRRPDGVAEDQFDSAMDDLIAMGATVPSPAWILPVLPNHRAELLRACLTHAQEARGDLRFYCTLLALINCCPVRYTHAPAQGRFTRRRNSMDYLDHHTVQIKVGRERVLKILDREGRAAEGSRHRAHEVRGHWMLAEYGKGGQGCRHMPLAVDGDHATCRNCGRKIKWRDHHMRGDASIGFVTKNYEVHK